MVRRRRASPEAAIQKAVIDHLKVRAAPGTFYFAVPNGGYRRSIEAAIMKSTGTKAGVPDLCLVRDGRAYFLELKTEDGKPSDIQIHRINEIVQAGAKVGIAYGLNRALEMLEGWELLRGRAA